MSRIYVIGHNGWGDNLHQRAAVRAMLEQGDELWLETSTPCIYHDLVGPKLHLVSSKTSLRTQAKNITREADRFKAPAPPTVRRMRVSYGGAAVRQAGSVLNAMLLAFGLDPDEVNTDFRMPIPDAWQVKVPGNLPEPFILYRPPIIRSEWDSTATRNPDPRWYGAIFAAIREDLPVVSVADLAPGQEWIHGKHPAVDREYHHGELDFETLAAVVSRAAFVYTTPGVITVLAQALGVPCITVFGGFEVAASFSGGATYSPWLAIEPITPCACWSNYHSCDKRIDVPQAIDRARQFLHDQTTAATWKQGDSSIA